MRLKIGELAKRTGLTVRTLHHYDDIGLLSPSARSDAGYRLYDESDLARLHRILALRRFGMALAEIGTYLSGPDLSLESIVERQIGMLDQQIAQATALRSRLARLRGQLDAGRQPDPADWLTTLEQMTMYDKYFTQEELQELPLVTQADQVEGEWQALVSEVHTLMDAGTSPADSKARSLAKRWMATLARDTNFNPILFAKLNTMHEQEPAVQERTGVTQHVMDFILAATKENQLAVYERYLDAEEMAFVRANLGKRNAEWPPLLARVRTAIDEGRAPDSPEAQALARHWFELFRSYAGDNPATQQKIRQALQNEPELKQPGMVDERMIGFIRAAMQSLQPQPAP
ncbi:MerR family transcriptional regulator [Massilia sp. Mn16-1_5]|uniref:MerR family transcriptional regulator n=1 Tax=Massilia sp. Mn16-1_5 TaxID=2079199 RepID=UPI00109ED49F|nr:MerR family transcriptional regulator [Massilia sp. Mn16-1_5]THC43637.1 MerR family transcriptional regulator [Massilia sp. Mn16-1_5]